MKKGTKAECRTHFKEVFRQHQALHGKFEIQESRLAQNILQFLGKYSGIWGSYKALSSEASVDQVSAARSDMTWVYPKMSGASLEFIKPTDWQAHAGFGVLEPVLTDGDLKVALDKIQGLLVPGLAFDRLGNRLGRGKGFYDQTLSAFGGIKVGIGFSWQISPESIPAESHDVKMDFIITEDSVIKCC